MASQEDGFLLHAILVFAFGAALLTTVAWQLLHGRTSEQAGFGLVFDWQEDGNVTATADMSSLGRDNEEDEKDIELWVRGGAGRIHTATGRLRSDKHTVRKMTVLTDRPKLIVYWSHRPGDDIVRSYDVVWNGAKAFKGCQWSDCKLTRDRSYLDRATVVVFRDYDPYPEWPPVRFSHQTYVQFLSGSPALHWWLPKFDDMINLTIAYRRDADVPHYIAVEERSDPSESPYVPSIPLANKSKSVVWAVSHCNVSSKREQYVTELSKHIDVDIYGQCGRLHCPRNDQQLCSEIWQTKYKFYLAFENSICQDYVTEKLYRTLGLELIPIVLGGADYKTAAPPHSYIDVRDYKSPNHLADYLKYLAKHEDEYLQYFQWKQKYDFSLSVDKMCKLCEIAHNMHKWSRPAHDNYSNWWTNSCNNDLIDQMRRKGRW